MTTRSPIDEHLERFDDAQRAALLRTCDVIRSALPGAVEVISYGMPTFKAGDASGPAIIGLEGFTRHNSLFPYSATIVQEFAGELSSYEQTKGSIHFERDRPFPATLLRRILRARIREINATPPKRKGAPVAYDSSGRVRPARP